MKTESELENAVVIAAMRFRDAHLSGGSVNIKLAEDAILNAINALEAYDPAIQGAAILTKAGLLEAAENGAELGTCDED